MKYTLKMLFRRLRRILTALIVLILVLCAASLLYITTTGFPRWLVSAVTGRLSEGQMYIEAGSIRLDPGRGFIMKDVVVFRDGVVGPPAAEVEEAVVVPDFKAALKNRLAVSKAIVNGSVIRPKLAISGKPSDKPPQFNTYGDFALEMHNTDVLGLKIPHLNCRMEIEGPALRVIDAVCLIGAGKAAGRIDHRMDTALMKGKGRTSFDLTLLIPVFKGLDMNAQARLLSDFRFHDNMPRTEFDFTRLCESNGFFNIEGSFWMEDCRFRTVAVERIDGNMTGSFSPTNSNVMVEDLLIARKEGTMRGNFEVDPRNAAVRFAGNSSIHPHALARIVDVYPTNLMEQLSFKGPVRINAKGKVNYRQPENSDIEAEVEAGNLGLRMFTADTCNFRLRSTGITNYLTGISGEIYDGTFSGNCRFDLPYKARTNVAYACKGKIHRAELEKIVSAITTNAAWDTSGEFTLDLEIFGLTGKGMGNTVTGEGKVRLREGKVFTMPLFGGFTKIMTRTIPGLNFVLSQNEVEAEFEIERNMIKSDLVLIEGDVLSLHADGDYYFDNSLDYKVQVRLLKERAFVGKILQTLMWPITTLFEFRLRGTLKNPRWYPVNFSDEVLERLGIK